MKKIDLIILIICSILILFFFISRLYYKIDENKIEFQFIPFILKPRIINFEDISSITICNYSPLSEFGGWGWRKNSTTRAYTTKGNKGILFHLKNGKNILIGTQKNKKVLYDELKNIVGNKVKILLN